jgi:hypothetical protein
MCPKIYLYATPPLTVVTLFPYPFQHVIISTIVGTDIFHCYLALTACKKEMVASAFHSTASNCHSMMTLIIFQLSFLI